MDFICEEDPNNTFEDQYYGIEESWYGGSCDDPEVPERDAPEVHCQEAQSRKSDLQLASRLDELANSLRSGTQPIFSDEVSLYSPGQTLNEFLCLLEKRLLEKTQSPGENYQDVREPDCKFRCISKTPISSSPKMRKKMSPARRLNFSNVSARPGPSTTRSRLEPPASPDWNAMLNDSNEIACYPSERLNMYGMTAGDIWKRRAEGKPSCKCPSPPRTPVRQVQAIPVRCIPSPKFDIEESLLSMSDMNRPEYCGCTVDEILRKKARARAKTFLDASSEDMPSWHHRHLDDSSFFKSKRHHHSRKHSPSRKKCRDFPEDRAPSPESSVNRQSMRHRKCPENGSQSKKGSNMMTCEEWLSKSRSNCSMCSCCDELSKRVEKWTESQFGGQNHKGVNAAIDCRALMGKKPLLKKKPTETSYKTFVSGISPCNTSTPSQLSSTRRPVECVDCSSPEVMAFMRERSRRPCSSNRSRHRQYYPRTPVNRQRGFTGKPTPMKLHLVTPPHAYHTIDDYFE